MVDAIFVAFSSAEMSLEEAQTALRKLTFASVEEAKGQLVKISRLSLPAVIKNSQDLCEPALVESFVELILWLSDAALVDTCTSLNLLEELLESLDLTIYERVFHHVETKVKTMELVHDKQKEVGARNILLRICKALLKRLSRVRHCRFRFRVQLLLTLIFHNVSELSGVNLAGTFTSYKAVYDTQSTDSLYLAVWSSHNSMLNPLGLFKPEKLASKCFEDISKVLSCMKPEKVTEICDFSFERRTAPGAIKYLLKDRNFVREYLTQVRILAHTLQVPAKQTQKEAFNLTENEHKALIKLDTTAAKMLAAVDSSTAKLVTRTLMNEDNWANWKDQKCKGFDRPPAERIGVVSVNGTAESSGREPGEVDSLPISTNFLTFQSIEPRLDDYIAQVDQDEDPDEDIDEMYKKRNDPIFTWRMLRLVSETSVRIFEKVYDGNVVNIVNEMKASTKRPREEDSTDTGYKQQKT